MGAALIGPVLIGSVARRALPPLVVFAFLGVLWQIVAGHDPTVLPPLGAVGRQLTDQPHFWFEQIRYTLLNAVLGFGFGVGIALLLATVLVHVPWLRSAIMPVAVLFNVTPVVAIAPALIIGFGFGRAPHVIVAALVSFFPMLVNALTGLDSVDRQALDLFRSVDASRYEIFTRLRFVSSLPYLFSAAKVCVSLAVIGSVISEFSDSSEGLGFTIASVTQYNNVAELWAAIFCSAAMALALLGLVSLAAKLTIRW
jgi:NitT/TauT family transport system permease protein